MPPQVCQYTIPEGTGYWDEDNEYPVADWKAEVSNDDTRLGYWEWVEMRWERDSEEGNDDP